MIKEDVATSLSIKLDMDIVTNGFPLEVFENFSMQSRVVKKTLQL